MTDGTGRGDAQHSPRAEPPEEPQQPLDPQRASHATNEPADSEGCWYFAYGSNMQSDTFVRRRGMQPVRSVCARLDGYRLCFDLPVGEGERGVANIVADEREYVCGVLHLISAAELERLDRSEGVDQGWYRRIGIELATLDGQRLRAWTLVSPFLTTGRKPSARYISLLLEGAREHGLPDDYVARLEALDLAVDERVKA